LLEVNDRTVVTVAYDDKKHNLRRLVGRSSLALPPSWAVYERPTATMMNPLDAAEVEELRRERRRRRRQKVSACCKSAVAFLFSHIGLAAMVVAYSIMGGFLFQWIEAPAEQSTKYRVRAARQRGIDEIWRLAAEMCDRRRRRRSSTIVADETTVAGVDAAYAAQFGAVLLEFQTEVLYAVQDLGWDGNDDVTETKLQWSFAGALLYAVTVITTIGITRSSVDSSSSSSSSSGSGSSSSYFCCCC